ncbi:NAD(P)-dependent oxidoreductase [Thiocapsa imhoffii]|uniref:NAD(P)-dependent oxidoreductase n=1 Tax=Thiocapsa imhoffii TaxID=382777 RepID=A0A9X1BA66_9GAMM|nr:SDR family oxidoreductase [Thiocapsa imhoffii]MBK1645785.1 NAD(P)-dependent oxidoreductase [Thiocapsa imhoffii]
MSEKFIIGCGYVGERLARQYLEAGEAVTGLVRTEASVTRLTDQGIRARAVDLSRETPSTLSFQDALVFHLAPPPGGGVRDPLTRHLIALFETLGSPKRVLYLSTTGVYGDCGGRWIDEHEPVKPVAERSQRRWDAEERLRDWSRASGGELVILRVAGIYGPERLPLARLRSGAPMVRPEQAPYTNRIHVEDLVTVCMAAMARAEPGAVYNVSDGHPSTMTEYFQAVAAAVGLPAPPLIPLEEAAGQVSEGMLSYLRESRRLRNDRLRTELGVVPRYPDLAAGLAALSTAPPAAAS